MNQLREAAFFKELPLPEMPVETPCFVILEQAVHQNLRETIRVVGNARRLVPHVKTHRAPWVTRYQISQGVHAFKTATPQEVAMVLEAGAVEAIWAYPTSNAAAISRVVRTARDFPKAKVVGLVDSTQSLALWRSAIANISTDNVRLRVDLDPGMGRTGIAMDREAIELALATQQSGLFDGWHLYDGHIKNVDIAERTRRFENVQNPLNTLFADAGRRGLPCDLIAGGSYSFPLWAARSDARVSPGSWIYSSAQHQVELHDLNWEVAAYVLSSALSERNGTITLDAGSKAISPDQPMNKRFRGVEKIVAMKEEHTVTVAPKLKPGDKIGLIPRHACTTAYLYNKALVLTIEGKWEYREQLGSSR